MNSNELVSKFNKLKGRYCDISREFTILFKEYKLNFENLTELASALHTLSINLSKEDKRTSNFYNNLFEEVNEYVIVKYSLKDLDYYFEKVGWEE